MSAVSVVTKIFKMFDKVDDIVYEPVKLVCDVFRQPLKEMDAKNKRKNMELENKLHCEIKQFEMELDLQHRKREGEIDANIRKVNAEIDEMITEADFERQTQIVEAIKRYQKDLGEASVELSNCIGCMSIELRERAYRLVDERTRAYKKMQDEALSDAETRFEELERRFPNGGKAKEIMESAIERQLIGIIENADKFICSMHDDIAQMMANIDHITAQAINNTNNYLSPMIAKGFAVSNNSYALENKY